ncbi:MAG: hypothetical protein PHP79_08705 [Clostridia bacterium]|nr:hypothetical protein [Clostridia bacterium]
MRKRDDEKGLLDKLASGALDGMVGDEKVYQGYRDVYCGKYIKDGVPVRQLKVIKDMPLSEYHEPLEVVFDVPSC